MGGARGVCALYALPPAAPSRREKKTLAYTCPLDPSRPLSQRKLSLCKNPRNLSKHCIVTVEFLFISVALTAIEHAAGFPQLKV